MALLGIYLYWLILYYLQIKEKVVGAAGLLCVGENIPHRQNLMEAFLELSKQVLSWSALILI